MADHDEEQVYKDLKGFLLADRSDLRAAATEACLQQAVGGDAEKLIRHGIVDLLAKNVQYDYDAQVQLNALQALVVLTSQGPSANQAVEDLLKTNGGINRMTSIALSSSWTTQRKQINFALSILANLTRTEQGAVEFVGKSLPDEALPVIAEAEQKVRPTMELLLSRFLQDSPYDEFDYDSLEFQDESATAKLDSHSGDPYQHFAAVLTNVTQVETGRNFVLKLQYTKKKKDEAPSCVFQKLLPQLRSKNPIRRRGIAGMIRNCCLSTDSAWWFLNVVKLTKHILYPLAGPEELDVEEKKGLDPDLWLKGPDKKREPDHYTRLFLVESILLLCASGRKSREQLRLERVYVILKWTDMVEEYEDVSAQIDECVQFLRRDEEGTQEGSSDKFVADAYFRKPAASRQIGTTDFDDVD